MKVTHTRPSAARKNTMFNFHVTPTGVIYRIKEDGSAENVTKNEKIENLKPVLNSNMVSIDADVEVVNVVKKLDSQLKNDFSWIHSQVDEQLNALLKKYPDAIFTGISINYEVVKEDVINIEL
jgi:hypothetical protein